MKLSEAIILGSGLVSMASGSDCEKRNGGCALTMAGPSVGAKAGEQGNIWQEAKRLWPWIADRKQHACPMCEKNEIDARWIIIHCFDLHIMTKQDMTLEQLVDYVRSIEPTELPDLPLSEQLRMEEEAAAEEGAAIEASGYRDPAENVRFA